MDSVSDSSGPPRFHLESLYKKMKELDLEDQQLSDNFFRLEIWQLRVAESYDPRIYYPRLERMKIHCT